MGSHHIIVGLTTKFQIVQDSNLMNRNGLSRVVFPAHFVFVVCHVFSSFK